MKPTQLDVDTIIGLLEKKDFGVVIIDHSENLRFISSELRAVEKIVKEVAKKKNKIVKIYYTAENDPNNLLKECFSSRFSSGRHNEDWYVDINVFKGEKILFVSPLDSYYEYNDDRHNNINRFFVCLQTVGEVDVLVMAPQRMWTIKLQKNYSFFGTVWGVTPGFTPSSDSMNSYESVNNSRGAVSRQGRKLLMAAISPQFMFNREQLRLIRIHLEILGFPVDIGTEIEVLERSDKIDQYDFSLILKPREKLFARINFNILFSEKIKKGLIGLLKKQNRNQKDFELWLDDLISRRMMGWSLENKREKFFTLIDKEKIKTGDNFPTKTKDVLGEICRLDPDVMGFVCDYFLKQ